MCKSWIKERKKGKEVKGMMKAHTKAQVSFGYKV
jgi:hypothetical protein